MGGGKIRAPVRMAVEVDVSTTVVVMATVTAVGGVLTEKEVGVAITDDGVPVLPSKEV